MHRPGQIYAGYTGHAQVGENQIKIIILDALKCLGRVCQALHLIAASTQVLRNGFHDKFFIINH
ncbi:hypothetical protein ES703_27647 [subsurface metagenome]